MKTFRHPRFTDSVRLIDVHEDFENISSTTTHVGTFVVCADNDPPNLSNNYVLIYCSTGFIDQKGFSASIVFIKIKMFNSVTCICISIEC